MELNLNSFKSFQDARLPIDQFTLLVGRNSSGKSNALDGLTVLSSLASGGELREVLDGGRDGPEIRGGALGCPPAGNDSFALGCTVESNSGIFSYELRVQVEPTVKVTYERLWTTRLAGARKGQDRDLIRTDPPYPDRSDIFARWDNQKQGPNPGVDCRDSQLVLTQVSSRVPATSSAGREVHDAASQVVSALLGVFVLDPDPHQMRQYVRRKDNRLRRNAANLSAALAELLDEDSSHDRILQLVAGLSEAQVSDVSIVDSTLDDVMLTLQEQIGGSTWDASARQVSDGTLRFLALIVALLQAPKKRPLSTEVGGLLGQTTLVLEELENGLHPSQAARIIDILRTEAGSRGVRLLATTHSPALLDALPGELHSSVIVAYRDEVGRSRLRRLPDLGSYFDIATAGSLGDAAINDDLRESARIQVDPRKALDELFSA